mgnify:CR=1 FL=1
MKTDIPTSPHVPQVKLAEMGTTGLEQWVRAASRKTFRLRFGKAKAIIQKRYGLRGREAFDRLIRGY